MTDWAWLILALIVWVILYHEVQRARSDRMEMLRLLRQISEQRYDEEKVED